MSEEFKNLNNTIASFMLLSLAFSGSALAGINENMVANAFAQPAYGVPVVGGPSIHPAYGVPAIDKPILHPAYGVPVIDKPVAYPAYGVPVIDKPVAHPAYGVPVIDKPVAHPAYGVPVIDKPAVKSEITRSTNVTPNEFKRMNFFDRTKQKDIDSKTPVNYVAPVIIQGYVIDSSK